MKNNFGDGQSVFDKFRAGSIAGFDPTKLKLYRPRGRPRKMTAEQEALVTELVAEGYALKSIAAALALNERTVRDSINRKQTQPA